jgi:Helicase associated domain
MSTLTDERVERLNSVGFVWSSHHTTFEERLDELRMFQQETGHCNVPSQYPPNQKLSTWVKCQRRQYKLLMEGQKSNMTDERIEILNKHGFVWEIRKHPPRKK